jgi:hypothetical protein
LDRGQPAEAHLPASAVVGAFDPGDDGDAQLFPGVPAAAVQAPLTAAKSTDRSTGAAPPALESVAANEVVDGVRLLELYRDRPVDVTGRLNQPPGSYQRYFDGVGWQQPTAEQWLSRYARVRPAVSRYTETLLLREALGRRRTLRVAQLGAADVGTWIGLPFPSGTGSPTSPVTGYVVDGPTIPDAADPLSGFMVDEWSEVVPRRTEVRDPVSGEPTGLTHESSTAGMAVNANGPNARAPQSLLLAVSPDGEPWNPAKVIDLLADTLAAARERAVTLEQVPLVGRLLPATYVQDWSLQGEPVLDMSLLLSKATVREAILTHIAEKD